MTRFRNCWRIAGLVVAVSLSGCGSGSDSSDTTTGTSATSTTSTRTPKQDAGTTQATKEQPTRDEPAEQAGTITLATTTSFHNTGLAQVLADQFREETGIAVKIVAQGTGAALEMGEEGNADVLVVHAPASEQKLVDSGACIERTTFMHNTFLVVGPESDPAKVAEAADAQDAFRRIAEAGAPFLSRGDDSGTHKKELAIWAAVDLSPAVGENDYGETGEGMGRTLLTANEQNAYTLSDIGTYLAYKAQGNIELAILCDKGEMLYNPYSVMLVNPEKFESGRIKAAEARKFAEYLQREDIQKQIGEFKRDEYNQSLFVPDLLPDENNE